jgi:hypothetical protein
MRRLMWILWPSFLVAIPASGVYFSLLDPVDLDLLGLHIAANNGVAYSIGFCAFWLLGAASSAMTVLLCRPAEQAGVPVDADQGGR